MKALEWCQKNQIDSPIIKVPLQFTFPPVEALMKQLTRLNSPHPYRISYLGPRWDNSVAFHKKYSAGGAYEFRERKVSKNTGLLHDSMSHNQFYKNQIYYRAFEGMNPTLNLQQEIIFESRFQSGNLDCAVKINDNEFDLFLRIDSNTRGNIFWFYFMIKNLKKGKKLKLNICNLTKADTHYTKGLYPFMYSSHTKSWTQDGMANATFMEKRLRYPFLYDKLKINTFYELSFEVESNGQQEIRLAYCIPYTYSDLLRELKELGPHAQIGSLGQTLTGVSIPIVMIGKNDLQNSKPVLLITGRIHPGQSNSSLIISNLMKYLCHHPQTKYLRQKVLTLIVPMTNPDGVILGNSRCGASGKDLNRQFKTRAKALFPEIILLKKLVDKISQTHELDTYLDFHGHSRKKNMFIFGPSYNITQPQYYKCRIFPKILSNLTPIFRYYSCNYQISYQKRSTARAVMLNEMLIPFVFTIQSSLGYYHDYNIHKDVVFNQKKWEEIGEYIIMALKEYFEGIEQYQNYIESKRKAKKIIAEQIKTANANTLSTNIHMVISTKKSVKEPKKEIKDIKLFKIYEQIKQLQQKKSKQEKRQSDDQSDSHDQKEQLEKQKNIEFTGMVTEFVEEECRKINNNNNFEKLLKNAKKADNQEEKNKLKAQRKKNRDQRLKQQQLYLKELTEESRPNIKRAQIKTTDNKFRGVSKEQNRMQRKEIVSQDIKKSNLIYRQSESSRKQKKFVLHEYLDEEVDFISVEKKTNNKLNVRMFNFSKMVQNPRSLRYNDHKEYVRMKQSPNNRQVDVFDTKRYSDYQQTAQYSTKNENGNRVNFFNMENFGSSYDESHKLKRQQSHRKNNTDEMKHIKARNGFPPSFYRIKYHNSQRKRNQTKRDKKLNEFEQFQKIAQYHSHHLNSFSTLEQKDIQLLQYQQQQNSSHDGLFLKVRKFPPI